MFVSGDRFSDPYDVQNFILRPFIYSKSLISGFTGRAAGRKAAILFCFGNNNRSGFLWTLKLQQCVRPYNNKDGRDAHTRTVVVGTMIRYR
jgi:hypothetical protein